MVIVSGFTGSLSFNALKQHPMKECNFFFIIKPTRCANFTNLLRHGVSDSSSVHHQEFIHCTLSDGICHTGLKTAFEQEHMFLLESCLQSCMTYISAKCTDSSLLMMGRGTARIM